MLQKLPAIEIKAEVKGNVFSAMSNGFAVKSFLQVLQC